jgi:esterase
VLDHLAESGVRPDVIVGHSYGGKVALAMAAESSYDRLQVWLIDSTPEIKAPSGSAWGMLALVRRLPQRFARREDATEAIIAGGYPRGVAQWMATNLVREGDAFVWRLDFDAMERLLRDFFQRDMWPVVESPRAGYDIHIIKASESSAISDEAVKRIERAKGERLHLHHRQGGHWIHAESPQLIAELLVEHMP